MIVEGAVAVVIFATVMANIEKSKKKAVRKKTAVPKKGSAVMSKKKSDLPAVVTPYVPPGVHMFDAMQRFMPSVDVVLAHRTPDPDMFSLRKMEELAERENRRFRVELAKTQEMRLEKWGIAASAGLAASPPEYTEFSLTRKVRKRGFWGDMKTVSEEEITARRR